MSVNSFLKTIKTFSFLDESGLLMPPVSTTSNYFGIGFIKHPKPFELNQKLHKYYENLCSELKKDETRVEFSFKSITKKSLNSTLKALDEMLHDSEWEFNCMYFDTENNCFKKPSSAIELWEFYVSSVKMLVRNNLWTSEETVLIGDYLRKPTQSNKKFEYIINDIPKVYNVLQVESHGLLLLQMADILLGGYLYNINKGKDKEGNKTAISKKVIDIKTKVGKKRFNVWEVDWNKSKQN